MTSDPYYGKIERMPMVSGTKGGDGRIFKFAILSIIIQNTPLVVSVKPARENSRAT